MAKTIVRHGRPKDAEAARAAILAAAEAAFAEHGFAGARVDAIAAASGYNKSLIFHYFGDKLGLYTEVIRRDEQQGRHLMELFADMLASNAALTPGVFRQSLEQVVRATFDYYVAHPGILRIMAWEEAAGWTTLAKIISQLDQSDVEKLTAVIKRAQQDGALRPDVSLPFALSVITNLCRAYLTSSRVLPLIIPDHNPFSPGNLAAAREQIVAFIVRGLTPDPASMAPDGLPAVH